VIQLDRMSGPKILSQAVMDAVWQWTYRPYLINGEPVEVETQITINFSHGE
jgi:protein TonB